MSFKQEKYAIAHGPGFKRQVGGSRTKAIQNLKIDPEEDPIKAKISALKERLSNSGEEAARNIHAQLGDIYFEERLFHLSGVHYRKALRFALAGDAFMQGKEYVSAAQCFEMIKDRDMARRAYWLAGKQAEKDGDSATAVRAFGKAGNMKKADKIKQRALAKQAIAQANREKNRKRIAERRRPGQMSDFERFSAGLGTNRKLPVFHGELNSVDRKKQ
jgi:hypothetical protein